MNRAKLAAGFEDEKQLRVLPYLNRFILRSQVVNLYLVRMSSSHLGIRLCRIKPTALGHWQFEEQSVFHCGVQGMDFSAGLLNRAEAFYDSGNISCWEKLWRSESTGTALQVDIENDQKLSGNQKMERTSEQGW